jgi:cobalt-zinc-cadmium efflux system membrane fusion protein
MKYKKITAFVLALLITSFLVYKTSKEVKEEAHHAATKVKSQNSNIITFEANAPQLAYLKIDVVHKGQVPTVEALQGFVAYDEDQTSRITSPVNGRVIQIFAKVGDKVKLGQSLAMMDSPDFGQANADLMKAESDLKLKEQSYERAKSLFEHEVLSKKEFENAESFFTQAKAEYQRALGRLKNYGVSKNNNFILSTKIAGTVTERQINPGSEVKIDNPNPLFIVSDPKHLWINIEVPEKDLDKVRVGQHLKIDSSAYPNGLFKAKVILISKVLNPETRRVVVRCEIDNLDEKLKPEMYVYATPLDGETELAYVPNDAVITEGIKNYIFIEKTPGAIEKRLVKVAYQGHQNSFITEGVAEGERVVINGTLLLNSEITGN